MTCACGCCSGTHASTPVAVLNPPGRDALAYRVGTHGTLMETMLARLTSHELPDAPRGRRPLQRLTARTPQDASIALLDAWATVGDVLTFYQERIANEGFLRTAIERRSLVELGRLLGYELRPAISSSAFLAFTVADDPTTVKGVLITTRTRAQSLPPAGGLPASFETSEDVLARPDFNTLLPRTQQPQRIDVIRATFMPSVTIDGAATGLAAGDLLLFEFGEDAGRQVVRRIDGVTVDHEHGRTRLTLALSLPERLERLAARLGVALGDAPAAGSPVTFAGRVRDLAGKAGDMAQAADPDPKLARALSDAIEELRIAAAAVVAELAAGDPAAIWVVGVVRLLAEADPLSGEPAHEPPSAGPNPRGDEAGDPIAVALEQLTAPLTRAPSGGPTTSARLLRDPRALFGGGSDLAAQLLSVQRPELAGTLHQALGRANLTQASELKAVYGLVKHPQPFGATAPRAPHYDGERLASFVEWNLDGSADGIPSGKSPPHSDRVVALDGRYPSVAAGSWVVVERPADLKALIRAAAEANDSAPAPPTMLEARRVARVTTRGVAAYNLAASVTQLDLGSGWLGGPLSGVELKRAHLTSQPLTGVRFTTIHADAQPLTVAPEPLLTDVEGDSIALDGIIDGLDSGRRLILTGERTDIPGVAGVHGGELVMLAAALQRVDTSLPGDTVHTVLVLASPLSYTYDRATVKIWGNVARSTQGETHAEVLGVGDPTQPLQSFRLSLGPLTNLAAANARGAQDTLEVRVDGVAWHETDDLLSLRPGDRSFLARTDDDGTTYATFGGAARLPSGPDNIRATYRAGSGGGGNVEAGKISQLLTRAQGVRDVVNPLPAVGGADREGIASARRSLPLAVMALDRLVSVRDYADFAQARAGIGKAGATMLGDGHGRVLHLTVAGVDDGPLEESSDLFVALREALVTLGDPSLPVAVGVREQRLIVIVAGVRVQADHAWPEVEPRLRGALLDRFGFDNRALGEPVVLSRVIAAAQAVRGVDAIDVQGFALAPEAITPDGLKALREQLGEAPPDRLLCESARRRPGGAGHLPAQLAVLSARVPDTLILTEVPS